jgi:hypothetical protein
VNLRERINEKKKKTVDCHAVACFMFEYIYIYVIFQFLELKFENYCTMTTIITSLQ